MDVSTRTSSLPQPAATAGAPAASAVRDSGFDPANNSRGRSFSDELRDGGKSSNTADKLSAPAQKLNKVDPKSARDEMNRISQPLDRNDLDRGDLDRNVVNQAKDALTSSGLNKLATPDRSSPVIAFITGHLEQVEPNQIPAMITQNSFIQAALSATDVNAFLNTPINLDQLLNTLGIDPSVLQTVNLATSEDGLVSPKDLFKALGIDASRISIELAQLKDNLSLEGVAPYMRRAAALRATTANRASRVTTKDASASQLNSPTLTSGLPDEEDEKNATILAGAQQVAAQSTPQTSAARAVPEAKRNQSPIAPAQPSAKVSTPNPLTSMSGGKSTKGVMDLGEQLQGASVEAVPV